MRQLIQLEPGSCRTMRPLFWPLHQTRRDRIHPNVLDPALKIPLISNGLLMEAGLPKFHTTSSTLVNLVRTTPLDELHGSFQCGAMPGREQKMQVIGHENEFMKEVSAGDAVAE